MRATFAGVLACEGLGARAGEGLGVRVAMRGQPRTMALGTPCASRTLEREQAGASPRIAPLTRNACARRSIEYATQRNDASRRET